MEEVCVLKKCGRISLVLSTLIANSLMLLFWTFARAHVWPRCFFMWFFKVLLAQGSKWKKCLCKFM